MFSLYKNNPKTMSDVLYRATKYMNVKDALLAREEKKMHDKIGDGSQPEPETEERIGIPNHPLEGL